MIRPTVLLRAGLAGALALSLAGCISLLPKNKPVQLYRFGATHAAAPVPTPAADPVGVFWGGGDFQRESSGDRILTVNGEKAAYIALIRWVAPADVLFQQAVAQAFESRGGRVRLVPRGAPGSTDYVLRMDVRNFETRYDAGSNGAPTVLIRVHAALTRGSNRQLVSEQMFEATAPARDNRVGGIVAAYDDALSQVLEKAVDWANVTVT
jgi:cholesterol transport system auxiliary component